ncbi:MAG: hypothetical protein HY344_02820 [Candidatus Levybacteria bacterium]|nr:hypothetical protein [Candidatus Levybacteria bacterium]
MADTEKEHSQSYTELVEAFNQAANSSNALISQAADLQTEARARFEELAALRGRMLEEKLRQRGLTVCSETPGRHDENPDRPEDRLGVFPQGEMRLLYEAVTVWAGGHGYEHLERDPVLKQLCPQHFPTKGLNLVWPSGHSSAKFDIRSEVVEHDGRLVTLVNEIDVTSLPPLRRGYTPDMYRHFGIPNLPTTPLITIR